MNFKFFISLAVVISIIFSNSILALELGDLEIISKKNEFFFAKIAVSSDLDLEESNIYVAIPSDADLEDMGIQPKNTYTDLNFYFIIDEKTPRRGTIIIRSEKPLFSNGKENIAVYIEDQVNIVSETRIYEYRNSKEILDAEEKPESIRKITKDNNSGIQINPVRSERAVTTQQFTSNNTLSVGTMDIVSGDNLDNVSTAIKDAKFNNDQLISKEQIMYIIKNNNSDSFVSTNSLNLRSNSQINIPERDQVAQIDRQIAIQFVNRFRRTETSQRTGQRRSNANNDTNNSAKRNVRAQNSTNANNFNNLNQQQLNLSENQINIVSDEEENFKQGLAVELANMSERRQELELHKNKIKNSLAELKNKISQIDNLINIQKEKLSLLTGGNDSYNNASSDNLISNLIGVIANGDPLIIIIFTIFAILFVSILFSVFFNFNKKANPRK